MMNELLTTMSKDMGIIRCIRESDDSFLYRICYSALGEWCLQTAQNSLGEVIGTTKYNQTIVLNELIARYTELFPTITDRFIDTVNQKLNFPVHIRHIYEETGYLLTGDGNRNRIANYGRSIKVGNEALFFGLPMSKHTVNGLGIFTSPTEYQVAQKEFLIRDELSWEGYFQSKFDVIDFYHKDLNISDLDFFNPLSNSAPSQSWSKSMVTCCTIARKSKLGPYYRAIRLSDSSIQFADEPIEPQSDGFTSYEFRRLYFALKAHYKKPLRATISRQDSVYSKINLGGYLPHREYYYLLLLSWPVNGAFDKVNFLIRNDFTNEISDILNSLGIEVNGGIENA